jgi:hypothetical protein
MGGFLSLYDERDRIEMGGGYYVEIKKFLSDAEHDRAQRALVSPRIESTVAKAGGGADEAEVRAVTTTIDQQGYNIEVLVAAIIDWNLTDETDQLLPLPPYMPPPSAGEDKVNRVRRESIRRLPHFAIERILKQISDNKKLGADDAATFQGQGEGAPQAP